MTAQTARAQMRQNLTPECVFRRAGCRGNRSARRLFGLTFRPIVNPNGSVSRWEPISAAWKAYAAKNPAEAEHYAYNFVRAYNYTRIFIPNAKF